MSTADPLRDFEDAQGRLDAARLAADPGGIAAAERDVADAREQLGLLFALLLRCALANPTSVVRDLGESLRPIIDQATAHQIEWQRRRINELLEELRMQGEAIARLEKRWHDATGHSPDQPGRVEYGEGYGGTGAGAGGTGGPERAAGPAAGRAAG